MRVPKSAKVAAQEECERRLAVADELRLQREKEERKEKLAKIQKNLVKTKEKLLLAEQRATRASAKVLSSKSALKLEKANSTKAIKAGKEAEGKAKSLEDVKTQLHDVREAYASLLQELAASLKAVDAKKRAQADEARAKARALAAAEVTDLRSAVGIDPCHAKAPSVPFSGEIDKPAAKED
eukprot:6173739-Pleurochrysis_carterae.AAC.6